MSVFTYKTTGTCSKMIELEIDGSKVKSVRFHGGCNGNLKGIGSLVEGMECSEAVARMKGIDCNGRGTSCPDQLAKAIEANMEL